MLTGTLKTLLEAAGQDWHDAFSDEFSKPYIAKIEETVRRDLNAGKMVYPPENLVLNSLALTPLDSVKVVILGQDPYHKPGEAMGLSFSVPDGVRIPPSLRNIYKELHSDIGCPIPSSGDLTPWARRGVLLLNASMTVVEKTPKSHSKCGWFSLSDAILKGISDRRENVAFILWGADARKKSALIDETRHFIHESEHPSPLAAYRGFFGSRPFTKVNTYLREHGRKEINWSL